MAEQDQEKDQGKGPQLVKEFKECPVCGSEERYGETLVKEVKEKGWMRPAYEFNAFIVQGAVKDPQWDHKIPIGSAVPAIIAYVAICWNCGTLYAVKLLNTKALKGVGPVPQPGQKGPPPGFPPLVMGRG